MSETPSYAARPFIDSDRVEGTIVYDAQGGNIGTIKRLMIEKVTGQVAYVVIVDRASDQHTIPWATLAYDTERSGYRTDITDSELRAAPRFAPGDEHDWSDRELEEQLHDFYRIPPYWRAI